MRPIAALSLGAPLAFLVVFFGVPLLAIVVFSVQQAGGGQPLPSPRLVMDTLLFTLGQAALSTALTVVLALPAAFVFTRYRFRGRRLLLALASLPFVMPPVVVAVAFRALLGRGGLLASLGVPPALLADQSLGLVLLAHIFFNVALVVRMVTAYWVTLSPRLEEAAQALGAGGWRLWWAVRLPLLRPVLGAAALLVFIYTFTSFGVVLILGGLRHATLEVQIYIYTTSLFNLPGAAVLSLVQLTVLALSVGVYLRLRRQVATDLASERDNARRPSTLAERLLVLGVVGGLGLFLLLPLAALVWLSLTYGADGFTLRHYALLWQPPRGGLFVAPWQAIATSVAFAVMTVLIAVPLGGLAALGLQRQRSVVADLVLMLPLGVSAVTLGFGFLLAFNTPPLALVGSWLLIPIAHSLAALPLVVRTLTPALRAVGGCLIEAASVLGASWRQRVRFVWLPLLSRALAVAVVFAFNVSLGEFGASTFLVRPDAATIPTAIYRLLGQPRPEQFGQALALSVILMLLCLLTFLLVERLRDYGTEEF